jgi:60 kDa SS-A/Ro ribonucleoprotein
VCLDIQPYSTASCRIATIFSNIGGFSDAVFEIIACFVHGELSSAHWVGIIEAVEL